MTTKQKESSHPAESASTMAQATEIAMDYGRVVIGAMLCAVAIDIFLVPNQVVGGGVTGISIMLNHLIGTPVGMGILVINVPVLWLGWRFGGGRPFFLRTLVGIVTTGLATDLLAPHLPVPTHDPLLVIFYGGLLQGCGLALVFHGRGTTGGIDVLALLVRRYHGIEVGRTMLAANLIIYAWAGFLFGPEPVMIAFALAFVAGKTLDSLLNGLSATRAVFIISADHEDVKNSILGYLKRGVTVLSGRGGYSGDPRPVLYVVVPRSEVSRLKRRVMEIDPHAFISISHAQDLAGGFRVPRHVD